MSITPAPPVPAGPSPPGGFSSRWWALHVLITLLAGLLAWLGVLAFLSEKVDEKYRFVGKLPAVVVLLLVFVLPWLPKGGKEHYRPAVDSLLHFQAWLMLRVYDLVFVVRQRRTLFLRLALWSTLVGAPALGILIWRHLSVSQERQERNLRFARAWDAMVEFVSDRVIADGAKEKFNELDDLFEKLEAKDDKARYATLQTVHRVLAGLYPRTRDEEERISFPNRCGKAAEAMSIEKIDTLSHPEVLMLLQARLYVRASQNGADIEAVNKAERLLKDGLKRIERDDGGLKEGVSPRLAIAYYNYLGVVYKLQAQRYEAYALTVGANGRADDRATRLKEAFNCYNKAKDLAEEKKLANAKARVLSNLVDWWLLLYAIFLHKEQSDKIVTEHLPYGIRTQVDSLHDPAYRVKRLAKEVRNLKQLFSERPTPGVLVTTAQAECLLALACHQNQKPRPPDLLRGPTCLEAKDHLKNALSCLQITAAVWDEIDIFAKKRFRDYHFGALYDLDEECQAVFEKLRKSGRDEGP